MRKIIPHKTPNMFNKKDPRFETLHQTMDSVYTNLRSDGNGASKHSTEIISQDEENLLWKTGSLSTNDPQSLIRAVFGKNVMLRGGVEHLTFSQLERVAYTQKTHPKIVPVAKQTS